MKPLAYSALDMSPSTPSKKQKSKTAEVTETPPKQKTQAVPVEEPAKENAMLDSGKRFGSSRNATYEPLVPSEEETLEEFTITSANAVPPAAKKGTASHSSSSCLTTFFIDN